MAKKRNCRRTIEESMIHEEAVRLRKMTDRQLVGAFRMAREDQKSAEKEADVSTEKPEEAKRTIISPDIEKLLTGLAEGKVKGVKSATTYKITEYARELGFIKDAE